MRRLGVRGHRDGRQRVVACVMAGSTAGIFTVDELRRDLALNSGTVVVRGMGTFSFALSVQQIQIISTTFRR